jgi:hypothetical protein
MTTRTSTALQDNFGMIYPQPVQQLKGRLPPLLVVSEWDHFLMLSEHFGAQTSQCPINPTASTMRREDEKKSEPRYLRVSMAIRCHLSETLVARVLKVTVIPDCPVL